MGQMSKALALLMGITAIDTEAELDWMAYKYLELQLFSNPLVDPLANGKALFKPFNERF